MLFCSACASSAKVPPPPAIEIELVRQVPPPAMLQCAPAPAVPICIATVPPSCLEADLRDYTIRLMGAWLDCRAALAGVREWAAAAGADSGVHSGTGALPGPLPP